jgi:hypothetical protein
VIVNVSPTEYGVPEPSAFVFQPVKKFPVFVIDPVSPRTVTVAPEEYGVVRSVGAAPPVCPFPL